LLGTRREIFVSLYRELQAESNQGALADEYGIDVGFVIATQ
jgi:hypothetical protein